MILGWFHQEYAYQVCFRPLTGKLVLIDIFDVLDERDLPQMFPSPYGEVGFDPFMESYETFTPHLQFPSPYGEVGFDLKTSRSDHDSASTEFPSPYGEVGFDHLITQEGKTCKKIQFPSPYGEVGFDQSTAARRKAVPNESVSVPLRGSWF